MLLYLYLHLYISASLLYLASPLGAQYLSVLQQLTVLGVVISNDLSCHSQSHKVHVKISSCIPVFCHFSHSLNFNSCLIAFNAFISLQLDYCLPVWGYFQWQISTDMDMVLLECAQVLHCQHNIKLSSLTMKSCSLCDYATLVYMSNVIAMFYQLRLSASSHPV